MDKFIMVANKEEADKAVEYFKGLGYFLGNFAPDYHSGTTSVVAEEEGRDIWHSNLNLEYYNDERTGYFEQHFLPEEPVVLQDIYIPVHNEEEFNQAKLIVEQMGYVPRSSCESYDGARNITCEDGKWYSGGAPEDGAYFEGKDIQKYFLKSATTYVLEKAPVTEKLYDIEHPSGYWSRDVTKQQVQEHIKYLQELIGE